MKKIFLTTLLLSIIACNKKSKIEFSLNGSTNGIKDSTYLYLSSNKFIDSTLVINNSFQFNTKILDMPTKATLRTSNWSENRMLWLEQNKMIFDASKGKFLNAKVSGSKSEDLKQTLYPIDNKTPWEKRVELEMTFVKNNPKSIVSASILSLYATTWGKEKTVTLFENFPINIKNTEYGKKISRFIKLNKSPKVGENCVDFKMLDQNGNYQQLSNLKDKIVLLEFWASWCRPCRIKNPNLVKTYEKFNAKGFEIFAVSLDEDKKYWIDAIKEDKLKWKHVSDLKGQENEASLIYGTNFIPANFLIDKNGKIIGQNLQGKELIKKLEEILE